MPINISAPSNGVPIKGLPPVTPPSGKFIAQLFLVPGLIVVVAVGILWAFTWLVGGSKTPEQFNKDLRNSNSEVRWRTASDLSQVLTKDPSLSSDPVFALDLADLLRQALNDTEATERLAITHSHQQVGAEGSGPTKEIQDSRAFVRFLVSCLGNFRIPIGVPILKEIALKESGSDPGTVASRRQLAIWSLANLGENLKHIGDASGEHQQAILNALQSELVSGTVERKRWAQFSHDFLATLFKGDKPRSGVNVVFAECARTPDPILRKLVAFALNIWEGDKEENTNMEDTLLQLTHDNGHGAETAQPIRSLEIRYKAAEGLARRGSKNTKSCFPLLSEMLDEPQQMQNFRTTLKDGSDVSDTASAQSTITSALRALTEFHRRRPDVDIADFYPAIAKLVVSTNPAVRMEAERTQIALAPK